LTQTTILIVAEQWPPVGVPLRLQRWPSELGEHPLLVVSGLMTALKWHRPYADKPKQMMQWLDPLFEAGRTRIRPHVYDLRELLEPPGDTLADLPSEDVWRASHAARLLHGGATRAARNAACRMHFLTAIRDLRRERDQRLASRVPSGAMPSEDRTG
jgi:hypothetical protein